MLPLGEKAVPTSRLRWSQATNHSSQRADAPTAQVPSASRPRTGTVPSVVGVSLFSCLSPRSMVLDWLWREGEPTDGTFIFLSFDFYHLVYLTSPYSHRRIFFHLLLSAGWKPRKARGVLDGPRAGELMVWIPVWVWNLEKQEHWWQEKNARSCWSGDTEHSILLLLSWLGPRGLGAVHSHPGGRSAASIHQFKC